MIITEKAGNIEILRLATENLNALVSEEIKNDVTELFENGTSRLIVDLDGVKYIDSSGFGALLAITRNAKNNFGVVKFCNIDPGVMKVLEMLHLHTVFNIFPNRESCIASF